MALWHIPIQDVMFKDNLLEDFFETAPPFHSLSKLKELDEFRDVLNAKKLHNFYHKLLRYQPYKTSRKQKKDNFVLQLDVKHYKPEEVKVKVQDRNLDVSGKHHNESENGFESSEFHRKYTIPEDIDETALTSNITQDGILHIEAPRKSSTTDNFKYILDVQGYKPADISIQVKGRELVIHGESKDENNSKQDTSLLQKQFTRSISLPNDVDLSQLRSCYTKDSKLTVEAPRSPPLKIAIKSE